ncbi:phosphotransferase family protein [Bacillus sp. WMMC1349]|uniref:phosphotransferase family protein n=1 Tax=Bacillus sp. WMMC1349 TaxID=2736254 RepID=UPI001558012C|nr:phosphotransferase family protein [Bacillus sp. WMMC1349]NPC93786.1 phosphotransferase family protein [Bacillus sp. WMMC1349]
MNWLGQLLGSEWEISPAGGATGDAFYAKHNGQQLFLKRNSSPFLAVLSAEGIVPKLVWTKRLENGDVITAQHWLKGRELKPKDMNSQAVAEMLRKIHTSKELLDMLKRLGIQPFQPSSVITQLKQFIQAQQYSIPQLEQVLFYLEHHLNDVKCAAKVVCHCDVNHNNWLLTDEDQLYLIDWDGAMIADPAIDLGHLLYHYVGEQDWENWLKRYGISLTDNLKLRMAWYVLAEAAISPLWQLKRGNHESFHQDLEQLNILIERLI